MDQFDFVIISVDAAYLTKIGGFFVRYGTKFV